jgi:hypothetical protein
MPIAKPIPTFLVPRPAMPTVLWAFEVLCEEALGGGRREIDYRLAAPKWQFLCYLADTRDILLHGSGDSTIDIFEPRQSNDVNVFGKLMARGSINQVWRQLVGRGEDKLA